MAMVSQAIEIFGMNKLAVALSSFFNTIFVPSHMYPENPEGTQIIVGSMNMGYISDIARNRIHSLFRLKKEPIPLGHSGGLLCSRRLYNQLRSWWKLGMVLRRSMKVGFRRGLKLSRYWRMCNIMNPESIIFYWNIYTLRLRKRFWCKQCIVN